MPKMKVEVDLLKVTEHIEAAPGDSLMVLGGRVIGVYTGRPPAGAAAPAPRKPGARAAPDKTRIAPKAVREEWKEKVLDFLRGHPGANLEAVAKGLKARRGGPDWKAVTNAMNSLKRAGAVVKADAAESDPRRITYTAAA